MYLKKRCYNQWCKGGVIDIMKKCSKCELNYIKDDEEFCSVCLEKWNNSKFGKSAGSGRHIYNEEFTFKRTMERYCGFEGFQAINSNGEKIGIVFMTQDKRVSSYGNCEIKVFSDFQNKYGMYHRFDLSYEMLCKILIKQKEYKYFVE